MSDPAPADPRQEITRQLPILQSPTNDQSTSSNQLQSSVQSIPTLSPQTMVMKIQTGTSTVSMSTNSNQPHAVITPFSDGTVPMTIPSLPTSPMSSVLS